MDFTLTKGNSCIVESLFSSEHKVDFQSSMDRRCPKGYTIRVLKPEKVCNDKFYLNFTDGNLVMSQTGKTYKTSEYCISPNGDANRKENHFARICVKKNNFARYTL